MWRIQGRRSSIHEFRTHAQRKEVAVKLATKVEGGDLDGNRWDELGHRVVEQAGWPSDGGVKSRRLTPIVMNCKMPTLYRLCHHLVCSYPLLPPMIKQENREQLFAGEQ
jgi:hypothetical protein